MDPKKTTPAWENIYEYKWITIQLCSCILVNQHGSRDTVSIYKLWWHIDRDPLPSLQKALLALCQSITSVSLLAGSFQQINNVFLIGRGNCPLGLYQSWHRWSAIVGLWVLHRDDPKRLAPQGASRLAGYLHWNVRNSDDQLRFSGLIWEVHIKWLICLITFDVQLSRHGADRRSTSFPIGGECPGSFCKATGWKNMELDNWRSMVSA